MSDNLILSFLLTWAICGPVWFFFLHKPFTRPVRWSIFGGGPVMWMLFVVVFLSLMVKGYRKLNKR